MVMLCFLQKTIHILLKINKVVMKFELKNESGGARRGQLEFKRGTETPAFMPVGTYGTVKGMTTEEVESIGAEIILGNTLSMVEPGQEVIKIMEISMTL